MPQSTYERVRLAAERLLRDDAHDRWALADAVLEAVPSGNGRNQHSPRAGEMLDQLANLTDQLTADGVQTPLGEPYTVSALENLRETAMAWPFDDRHDQAAYRTHQEAGSPKTDGGKVLAALCAVVRREQVRRPSIAEVEAWRSAVERIEAKMARPRTPRFPIAANDLRAALGRQANVPGRPVTASEVAAGLRDPEVRQAALAQLVDTDGHGAASTLAIDATRASTHITDPVDAGIRSEGRQQSASERVALGRARDRLTLEGLLRSITGEARAAIRLAQAGEPGVFGDLDDQIETVITMLQGLKSIVTGEGVVTDDDLADLLEGGE